jgi:cysteine desulfurase
MNVIYFDNNATTRLDPVVAATMHQIALRGLANPSSQHRAGREARKILETSRDGLARHLGCRTDGMQADQIFFTSGGTESNNLAILGLSQPFANSQTAGNSQSQQVLSSSKLAATIVSTIEHPSVLGAVERLSKNGVPVRYCPVLQNGKINLDAFAQLISQHDKAIDTADKANQIALVSVMLANNETGVIQPIADIVALCRPRGILVHTDAVQVLGKIPLSFQDLDVDAMTVTAHKVHGPPGIGALVTRAGIRVEPQLFGGFQQLAIRPGTECVALAAGFEQAAAIAVEAVGERSSKMTQMRELLESKLLASPTKPTILGREVDRLPHTTSIAYHGLDRQALQMALDYAGVACSTGSACASGSGQPSHVLRAMGVDEQLIRGAIRFSLSHETTFEEVEWAAAKINSVVETLASKNAPSNVLAEKLSSDAFSAAKLPSDQLEKIV